MPAHFEKEIQLRFREADPAGVLFFAQFFALAHDCFEDFLQAVGISWNDWFRSKDYLVPIRHTECEFLRPLSPGQKCTIQACVVKMGDSSFKMKYVFFSGNEICAEVLMVHTFLAAQSKQKISVPQQIRFQFSPYLEVNNEKN